MSKKHLQELMKNLQEFYQCPSCSANYHFDDIKLLGQIDNYCFVQLTCHSCSLPLLHTLSLEGGAVSRKETDLRHYEETKFASRGAISAGEIAEFHRALSSWRGGISKFIR